MARNELWTVGSLVAKSPVTGSIHATSERLSVLLAALKTTERAYAMPWQCIAATARMGVGHLSSR